MQSTVDIRSIHPAGRIMDSALDARVLRSPRVEAWRQRIVNLTLVFSDVVLVLLVWEIACVAMIFWSPGYLNAFAVASIVPVTFVWLGLRASQGLYPGYGIDEAEELRRQTYSLVTTLAFAAIFALAFQIGDVISRFLLLVVFGGLLFLSPVARHFAKKWMWRRGVWGKPVIVMGGEHAGRRMEDLLAEEWKLGFLPVAFFEAGDDDGDALGQAVEFGRKHRIETVFITAPGEPVAKLADAAGMYFRSVIVIPDLQGVTSSAVVARNLAGTLGVEVKHNLLDPWVRRFKRGLDLFGAVAGGVLIGPVVLLLAIMIRLDSRGPVFFGHGRLGARHARFRCWKFRTMHADADRLLEEHLEANPELRVEWERDFKLRDDPRVTRVGRFLRKTSLDELPQLWNVLRGEMSLVGPRPIVDAEVARYGDVYNLYTRIKPGMSGFWQVSGRSDTSYDNRVGMDAHYVRNWSVWLDLIILVRTVRCVLAREGAC